MTINSFREAVRDRILSGMLGAAIVSLLVILVITQLSLDQHARVLFDLGYASISFFSVVMAIFLGSSLLYKEIERKTLYMVLPKPIRRGEFLVGKHFGICLTAFVFVCAMGSVQLLTMSFLVGMNPLILLGVVAGLVIGVVGAPACGPR